MAIVSDVEIRLRADIARLQQDMTAMRRTVDNGMSAVSRSVEAAKKALAGFGAAFTLKELASQLISAQREFDKLNASLVTATGSTAGAAQAFGALQKFAATTPYSVAEATDAFIKLRNLGLSPSEAALRSYGNTSAAMGKSLNQMIEAVADAATGQFERLKEFGITSKQNGDRVSLTFQGITKVIGNNSKEIQAYLRAIGDVNFNGAMEARANTLDGAISNLGDTWSSVLRTINTNGFGQGVMAGVLALSGALTDLSAILDAVGGAATKEGKAVQEASGLHKILTMTFEAVAAVGVNVGYIFQALGGDIGAFAAQAQALFDGGMKGLLDGSTLKTVQNIGRERVKEAEDEAKAVEQKTKDIMTASKRAEDARAKDAAAAAKSGKDQLAGYEVILTAEELRNKALTDTLDLRNKLNGVDADTAGNLAKLKVALDAGAISQNEYNKYVAKINKDATMATTAYKDGAKALDLSTEAVKRRAQAQDAANKVDQAALDYQKAMGQINEDDYITQSADKSIKALNDQKAALVAQQALLAKRYDTEVARAALATQIEAKDQDIAAAKIARDHKLDELDKAREQAAIDRTADIVQGAKDEAKVQADRTRDMQEEVAALGLTGAALADVTAARLREQAAILDRKANASMIDEETEALHRQADELRKQADLGLTKQRVQEQQKFWGDVESTAREVFLSIGDTSKSLWQRMKDSAKTLFFDWLYQMTLKKWIINIGASISGDSAVAGLMNNSGGGLMDSLSKMFSSGSGGGFEGLLRAGQTMYTGFATGLRTSLGGTITSLGKTFGSSAMESFGAGFSGTAGAGASGAGATGAAGAGSSAAAAIPIAGAVIAGMMANNNFYKQGWRLDGQANDIIKSQLGSMLKGNALAPITAIMTASMSSFEKILGKLGVNSQFASMLSGSAVFARAFGHKAPEIQAQGLQGTISANGFSGSAYADIKEKGGWFRSDKNYTKTQALSADQQTGLNDTVRGMVDSVKGFAQVLGLQADAVNGYSKAIKVTLTDDEEKNKQLIADAFGSVGDELALAAMPGLTKFQQSGEKASATLQRLAADFVAVDGVLAAMGTDSQTAFKAVGAASIEARERLIALAGGLDALSSQTQFFISNFLSKAEQVALVQKPLNEQLAALGFAGIATTKQFKDAVQGLVASGALATEAGAKQYAGLLALAPQFKTVADYMDEMAQAAKDLAAQEAQAAAAAKQLADEENQRQREAAMNYVDQTNEAVQRAVAAQRDIVTKAYEKTIAGLETSISSLNSSLEVTRNLSTTIKGALASTTVAGTEGMARASAQEQIRTALTVARATGVLPKADDIRDALATVGRDATDQFSTLADYVRSTARTLNDAAQLGDIADAQVSIQERQLAALMDQKAIATAAYNAEMARLDNVLALAQQQVDAIHGVDNSVQSVLAALAGLQGALALAANPPTTSAGGGTGGMSLEDAYAKVLGRTADASGLAYWKNVFGNVVDSTELAQFTQGAAPELAAKANGTWAEFLTQHGAGGTASVAGSDSAAMLSELQTLNERMRNVEQSTGQFAQQFDSVSAGGNSLLTESANG